MWQVTPGTFGSSKLETHTLSLGESKLNVVLMQLKSSARAIAGAATKSAVAIKHSFTFDLHFQGAFGRLRAFRLLSSAEASSNAARPQDRSGSAESSRDAGHKRALAPHLAALAHSKAGTKILVAEVKRQPIHGTLKTIVVDKKKSQVLGYDREGHVLVAYPATIGSRELPSPSGTYKVKGVAYNPIYYYDPDKNFVQSGNNEKLRLPPGPNNPVGSVYIALTKPTYGLHGTPDPSKIDKNASHGCVRMTNWDASELAHLVKRGIVVAFKS